MALCDIELEPIATAETAQPVAVVPSVNRVAATRREIRIRQLRERHWTMLCVALFIIIASFTLHRDGGGAVSVPGVNVQLPTLCMSRALFNVECPGCGLTRSFLALASGDLRQSWQLHRLGWLLALAIVAQIPYRIYSLWEMRRGLVERAWPTWVGHFLIAALIVNWLAKVSGL